MKLIPLNTRNKKSKTHGIYFAQVDDNMFEYLSQWLWCARKSKHTFYVARNEKVGNRVVTTTMHRVIMGLSREDKRVVDHIDHNGYNNQITNLRICTRSQNCMNRNKIDNATSNFKGVTVVCSKRFSKKKQDFIYHKVKFRSEIKINGNRMRLGTFITERDAAIAYNSAAIKMFGEFAILNDV